VTTPIIRAAEPGEVDAVARIWHAGWWDTHAPLMPAELRQYRTEVSFRERLSPALPSVRVAGAPGEPIGFCMIKGDELYQLYVAPSARGSGVAGALLADAEARIAALGGGVATAWLACAIGNHRAARFYEKHGWRNVGTMINRLDTPDGEFPLEVWRYEKALRDGAQPLT
jgi:GNAT superfamily N-acetyltransferase